MSIPLFLESFQADLWFAIRSYRRCPGFTATALIAVCLGVGSATAVFSVVDPVLFRALPYREANRLVSLGATAPVVSGGLLGACGAYAATSLISSLLFRVSTTDPLAMAGTVIALLLAALLATAGPARKAASVDPMTALRSK